MTITTTFVSSVAELGFADAAEALESLAGTDIPVGPVTLSIGEPVGRGIAGAVIFSGVLRSPGIVARRVPVDVMVSPWSIQKSELGIRPVGRTGQPESLRSRLFLRSAWTVLPALIDSVASRVPTVQPVLEPAA